MFLEHQEETALHPLRNLQGSTAKINLLEAIKQPFKENFKMLKPSVRNLSERIIIRLPEEIINRQETEENNIFQFS